MILVFWMLSFKPAFLLSCFTLIKRLFSSSLPAIRVASSAYLRLLILLWAILIPACDSSSPSFHMMYSAEKSKKQGDSLQLVVLLCQFGTISCSNYWFLTQIQVSYVTGKVVRYSYPFKNFPQFVVIHTVKGFSIVNEARSRYFSETPTLSPWPNN